MKTTVIAAAALAAAFALPATAAPVGVAKDLATVAPTLEVEQVHLGNRHRTCQLGRFGWHYHDRWGGRIECRPFRGPRRY